MTTVHIRPMQRDDIPKLAAMRPGFVSDRVLKVEKTVNGFMGGWRLVEVPLNQPFDKGAGYDFDDTERGHIAKRLAQPNTLLEVVEVQKRIVGVLDVEAEEWRQAAWIWNIMLDQDVRGQGIGRQLIQHTIAWAKKLRLRAVMLETQTNNVPACKFYLRMGFQLVGINDAFYTNRDLERDEVALFWSYPL